MEIDLRDLAFGFPRVQRALSVREKLPAFSKGVLGFKAVWSCQTLRLGVSCPNRSALEESYRSTLLCAFVWGL